MSKVNNISVQLKNVQLGYSAEKPVFTGLDISLQSGSFVGLIGNNGIGKSTLLKTLCGVLQPLSGEVFIDSKKTQEYSQQDLAQLVSVVLTEKVEGFNLTVFDVVAIGRYPYTNYFGELSKDDIQVIDRYIDLCGITNVKHKNISEVSDGERQKTMIAKALAQQTPIILLDEPTAFLDYSSKNNITKLLRDLAHEENKIIILSSHDLEMLFRNADACLLLANNDKYIFDNPSKLLGTEEIQALTGGFKFIL